MKPWEKYQQQEPQGPWLKYKKKEADTPAEEPTPPQPRPTTPQDAPILAENPAQQRLINMGKVPTTASADAREIALTGIGTEDSRQRLGDIEKIEDETLHRVLSSGTPFDDIPKRDRYYAERAWVRQLPEQKGISDKVDLSHAFAMMGAFDTDELGRILQDADPDVDILRSTNGVPIAYNKRTGAIAQLNKEGLSGFDLFQAGGAATMFTPAGFARNLGMRAIGAAATQGLMEGGQSAAGGEFDPGDVALAAGVGLAADVAIPVVKAGLEKIHRPKAAQGYIDDLLKGIEQKPPHLLGQTDEALKTAGTVNENLSKAQIRQAMLEGSVESVGYTVNRNGHIVSDPLQRELLRDGVSDKAVVTLRNLTGGDKVAGRKMVSLAERYIKGIKGSATSRPNAVIGDSAMQRFDVIQKAQRKASTDIGAAVTKDLKGNYVEITSVIDDFDSELERLGVKVNGEALDFTESLIQGSNTTAIRNVYKHLKREYADASQLHDIKKFISNQIDYTKKPGLVKTLDDDAERALKSLRSGINDKLRGMSDDYAGANDRFRAAVEALQPFAESMGRKFDPESTRIDNYVGQELRKTLTNYSSANPMIEALEGLEATARGFGGEFSDDIMNLVVLNSELERIFGSFAPGSAQGIGEKVLGVASDQALGGFSAPAKSFMKEAKDKLIFTPPSREKLITLERLRTLINR